MKLKCALAPLIVFQSVLYWLSLAAATAQPLASRSSMAAAYVERGNAWVAKGDINGALADYNQAINIDPSFSGARFNRAAYWKAKGDLKQAESDFTQAIELKPQWADAYAQRGLALLLSGRDEEAERDFARCLRLNKNLKQPLARLIAEAKQ